MSRLRIILLSLVAVLAFSAVAAGAAQAEAGGPFWIVPCHKVTAANKSKSRYKNSTCTEVESGGGFDTQLFSGENKTIAKIAGVSAVQTLKTKALTIECPSIGVKAGATNTINGGNPGTDAATLVFTGCHPAGLPLTECGVKSKGAANAGEIIVAVKTLLGYAEGRTEKTPIYVQFFPEPGPELFVELEITGTKCGELPKKAFKVTATGTEYKPFKSKCGVIAEVGKIKAGVFEPAILGELFKLGGLRLPATAITKEEVWNSETKKFEKITCTLEANKEAATQSGEVSVELEKGEEFGVEN